MFAVFPCSAIRRFSRGFVAALFMAFAGEACFAQSPSDTANPPVLPMESLRPTLNHISEVIAGLNVSRWKAPGEVRTVAQRDINSIQQDLNSTLPPLMDQASKSPNSSSASFAVYRNIDAVYDVLLRVAETATLAGSANDATNLQATLTSLESARRDLGDSTLRLANSQEQELVGLRAAAVQAAAAAAAAPPPPPTKTVVEDGPATPKTAAGAKRQKKKPTTPSSVAPAGPAPTPQN